MFDSESRKTFAPTNKLLLSPTIFSFHFFFISDNDKSERRKNVSIHK